MTEHLPARRLAPEQVDAILRRAARADVLVARPSRHDPTVADLMEAAREVGLDPGDVRRAAAVEPLPEGGAATLALGAPDSREVRAFLDGARLPDDRDGLRRAVERALGRRGQVEADVTDRWAWKEDHTFGRTALTLVQEEGGVELTLRADRAGHYLAAWFGGVVGWAGLSWLLPFGWGGPPGLVLSFVLLPLLLARPFWARSDRKARAHLDRVAMETLRVVDGAGPDDQAQPGELPPPS